MKKIRLTESDLHNMVKEAVRRIVNEDYLSSNAFFQGGGVSDGDFAEALYQAYAYASAGNQERLRKAFPEYFSEERMFGNEKDPFDYRDFPSRKHYDEHWKAWRERNPKV